MSEKNKWQQYKEKYGTTPFDLLNINTKWVSDEIKKERLDICLSCPELIQLTKTCKKCGCFMEIKTKLEASKCPIGEW
jgi:hypothetical protein